MVKGPPGEIRIWQWSAVGPLCHSDRTVVRYGAAILLVIAIYGLRVALTPILGTQAPLLPFILAVLAAGIIGGFGPAITATLLVPLLATLNFANWSYGPDVVAWSGHVTFFVVTSASVALILQRLQKAMREQQDTVALAEAAAARATASEAQVRLIADGVPVLICYVGADRVYRFVNGNYAAWFNRKATEMAGRHVRELLGEENYSRVSPKIDQVLAGLRVDFPVAMSLASRARHVSAHYLPDFAPDGSVRGFFGLIEDVTERLQAEAALRANARQRDQFLAMLAHELRNPLQNIRFATDLLRSHDADLAMVRRNVDVVHKHTAALTRLIDDLLDVTRVTHGTIPLRKQHVSMNFVLRTAVDSVRPIFKAKGQTISENLCAEMLMVDADPLRLSQAFSNLLTNAAQYSPADSVVRVATERFQDDVVVRISDDGVGIPPEDLPHIFDLFTRTNHAFRGHESGIGVGLTVARQLIELHGGRIDARSDGVGKGSVFEVRLRQIPAAPGSGATAGPAERYESRTG
jgi:PAS domain S-box-containing protein